jgi:hypothetical protein
MKRQLYIFVILLGIGSLVVGTVVYFTVRPMQGTSNPEHPGPAAESPFPNAPLAKALGGDDRARLPGDRVLLPAAEAAECRGRVVSGESLWGVSELREKSVLWEEGQRHLVVLLPNERLAELQGKLTPT